MNVNEYDVFIMSYCGWEEKKYYYIFILNENIPTETIDKNRRVIVYRHFSNKGI